MKRSTVLRLESAGLLLACLLTGCASWSEYFQNGLKVGPNYYRPPAPVAEGWIDASDPRVISQPAELAAWWTELNDPALNWLVQSAYEQNLTLRTAALRVLEARAQRRIAAGSFFPQLQTLDASFQHLQVSSELATARILPDHNFSLWDLGGNLAWELDFWGRFRRSIEAADAQLDASVEGYDDVLVLLLADVASTYTEYRTLEQRLKYARQNVEIQQGSLKIAEAKAKAGARGSELDLPQARSNLAQTQAIIPQLEISLRQASNRLCTLLGMPPGNLDHLLGVEGSIPSVAPGTVIGIPADLLRRRPDVRRAERLLAAQSAQIGLAVSDLYPHITIAGSILFDASQFGDLFKSSALAGNVGPSIQWNILNYGRLVGNIDVQQARFEQLVVTYQESVLRANQEAENAIVSFLHSQRRVQYLETSVTSASKAVEIAVRKYQAGDIDFDRVFNLQGLLVVEQDALASSQGQVTTSLIQLYKALGGGWQIRLEDSMPATEPPPQPDP